MGRPRLAIGLFSLIWTALLISLSRRRPFSLPPGGLLCVSAPCEKFRASRLAPCNSEAIQTVGSRSPPSGRG